MMMDKLNSFKTNICNAIALLAVCFSSYAQINPASSCDNLDFRRVDFTGWT